MSQVPAIPKFESRPEVPDGGFGPNENEIRRAPPSAKESIDDSTGSDEVCSDKNHFSVTIRTKGKSLIVQYSESFKKKKIFRYSEN